MTRPWRIRYAGAKYHVTSRGNGRKAVFLGRADYARFLEQLDNALEQDEVILYAYTLMPNHFHLLLETPRGNLNRFMQRLNTAYSMYFRYRHSRPGHCFQDRYAAKLVSGDEYILRVTRYIHLNPIKVQKYSGRTIDEKTDRLNTYSWSSYHGYAGLGEPEERVDYRWLGLLGRKTDKGRRSAYRKYVESMAGKKEDEALSKAREASRYAIGDDKFRENAEQELRSRKLEKAVTGDIVWPEDRMLSLEQVEDAVLAEFDMSKEEIRKHARHMGGVKAVAVELCCRYTGKSYRETGRRLGYTGDSAVGSQRKVFKRRLSADKQLMKRFRRICGNLSNC